MDAYCTKCKGERAVQGAYLQQANNGKMGLRGTCPECGTKLSRLLSASQAEELKKNLEVRS